MLAHDTGASKSANHLYLIHLVSGLVTTSRMVALMGILFLVFGPGNGYAQLIPERSPGPRLEVEAPPDISPVETPSTTPAWVLKGSGRTQAAVQKALEAAKNQDPRRCLEWILEVESTEAMRLAFASHVALGNRSQADAFFHELSWDDAGRSAARLAAWRGIEDGDPFLVRRALGAVQDKTQGEEAALIWADWQDGQSLDGSIPEGFVPGVAGSFVDLARAFQTGRSSGLESEAMPAEWVGVWEQMQNQGQAGAREAMLAAYDASLRENWQNALAQSNQLLALYPNSVFRGQAYLLRSLGRLAQGEPELARADFNLAQNFLQSSMPVQLGLLEAFLTLQDGNPEGAERQLLQLRQSPMGQGQEPVLLFHAARLARFRGDTEESADAKLVLEEAYGSSPWYTRALNDDDSNQWGMPVIEIPIPPAQAAAKIPPPHRGPFGLMLWGDAFLAQTAAEVSQSLQREPYPETVDAVVMEARPVTPNGAYVLAGGGSRDTRYLEWEWIKDDFSSLGFRINGALIRTQEGTALPTSRRTNLSVSLRKEKDYGRLRVDGRWDARSEGARALRAKGGTISLNFDSSDSRETSGIRQAGLKGTFGRIQTETSEWEYVWFETQGKSVHSALLGDLESAWGLNVGIQSHLGERSFPWQVGGALSLPVKSAGQVSINVAASETEFYLLPAASFQIELPGRFGFWGSWEPRMEYPDYHGMFVREGDWNVPDFQLAPVVMPVHVAAGLSWKSLNTTLEASGTHFQADNYRTWSEPDGTWRETALDHVRAYELAFRGSHLWEESVLFAVAIQNARVEQFGTRVAFSPSWTGKMELGIPYKNWYYGGILEGITGRRNNEGHAYGSYVGLNVEATYHTPIGVAASLRVVNLTNSPVRRWPDKAIFSRGIYAGLGYQFGS